MAGKLQNEDFKTETELVSAGGSKDQLLNDTKIYVTGNGINKTLDDAIADGDLGGGGGGGTATEISFQASRTTNQSITTSAETDVVYTNTSGAAFASFDNTGGNFNTTTGIFTVPVGGAGTYFFKAQASLGSAINENYTMRFRDAGTNDLLGQSAAEHDAPNTLHVSTLVELTDGQTVKVTIDSTSDTSYSLQAPTYWSGFRVIDTSAGGSSFTPVTFAAYRSSNQSVTSTAITLIELDSVDVDSDSGWNGGTYTYTIPSDGVWQIQLAVATTSFTSNELLQARMNVNGALRAAEFHSTASGNSHSSLSKVLTLTAGDEITFNAKSAVDTSWNIGGDANGANTYASVIKISD